VEASDLPSSLPDLRLAIVSGHLERTALPPALLLAFVGLDGADGSADETQRIGFRAGASPERPTDLQAAFARPVLKWVQKTRSGARISSMVSLGRSGTNDIALPVPTLSLVHLVIMKGPTGYHFMDRGSTGAWVNGQPLGKAGRAARSGDYLLLGPNTRALFLEPPELLEFTMRWRAPGGAT
jgi:hypothetical protein